MFYPEVQGDCRRHDVLCRALKCEPFIHPLLVPQNITRLQQKRVNLPRRNTRPSTVTRVRRRGDNGAAMWISIETYVESTAVTRSATNPSCAAPATSNTPSRFRSNRISIKFVSTATSGVAVPTLAPVSHSCTSTATRKPSAATKTAVNICVTPASGMAKYLRSRRVSDGGGSTATDRRPAR